VRERVDVLPASRPHHRRHRPADRRGAGASIVKATGADRLAFFDAIAPIVHRDSIDMSICWMASALGQGEARTTSTAR
jgi:methylenetetrahydrofolate--tRNA-(uracil-5-)-methyltransferase